MCVDALSNSGYYNQEGVRQTFRNKRINLDLYNGITHRQDIEAFCNPNGLDADYIPVKMQHYPIMTPRLDLLIGEEIKRKFEWTAMVTNPEAISLKETEKLAEARQKLQALLQSQLSEEEFQKEFQKLQDYMNYEYQDLREWRANILIQHYWKEYRMEQVFNQGFKHALLMAEETYRVDIVSNEPIIEILNPLTVHTLRSGNSNKIEDSDIILIDEYWSPGKVIDRYHESLKPKEIDEIERGFIGNGGVDDPFVGNMEPTPIYGSIAPAGSTADIFASATATMEANGSSFNRSYDNNGNVRVMHVYWKSMRKVLQVTYFDPATGEELQDIFPETYELDKDAGETSKTLWVNEWWEGTKIGNSIYIDMRPRQVQYWKMSNPSYCHPGITGRAYNTNQSTAVSLVDRMKNLQYLYNIIHDRLNEAIAKNHGKILEMDMGMIPHDWSVDKWMTYVTKMGVAVKNSFKEVRKGAATGTLAGNMGHSGHSIIDAETGAYIQGHVGLLEFVRKQMGEISGVTEQRLGQIENRETVGGVERSVAQSSHVTEYWFYEHEQVKLDALNIFLETAKIALRGNKKKAQYILDDQSIQMLDIDGDEFAESDYGIVLTASHKSQELEASMKELAHAALQNDKMSFSTLMDIYLSPSLADIRRKIERSEQASQERDAQAQEAQIKQAEAQMQMQMQAEAAKMELDREKNMRDNQTRIDVEILKQSNNESERIAAQDKSFDESKLNVEANQFGRDLEAQLKMHRDKMRVEEKKITASKQKPNTPAKK